ncbi:MAG: hypothetical protein E7053_00435 [Lentisphaerae bacterium]|nr:hypothetical protein [Lentisphaerota bacterium]
MFRKTLLFIALCLASIVTSADDLMRDLPFFPIVGHNFLWRADARIIQDQAAMGLTLITVNSAEELDWCQQAGIKGIVWEPRIEYLLNTPDDPQLTARFTDLARNFKDHPAFAGLALTDEPGKSIMPGYTAAYRAIKAVLPDLPVYTNLFPSWSQPYQHGFANYEQYISEFCKLYASLPHPVLTFDNYRNLDHRLSAVERKASFLENLDTVSKITAQYNMPFWATVLSAAHDHYPDPSAADLEFEVFSSLAYGARGICYFTTVSHQNMIFQGGPFNMLGDKTPLYTIMRELNYRIRKLAPVLLTLKSTGVYYSLAASDRITFRKYPMHKMLPGRLIRSVTSDRQNQSFLVGEFTDDNGDNWVMIVNLDLQKTANFRCEFNGNLQLQHFNSYTGTLYPPQVSDSWLRPGQGKLYKVIAR